MENLIQKRDELIAFTKYFQERRQIILGNIRHDEAQLAEMDRRGKERGIVGPIVVPEGYWDSEKELKDGIAIMQEQLKECDQDIQNIHEQMKQFFIL